MTCARSGALAACGAACGGMHELCVFFVDEPSAVSTWVLLTRCQELLGYTCCLPLDSC